MLPLGSVTAQGTLKATQRATPAARPAANSEAECQAPADQITLSDAPKANAGVMARLGKTAAALALAGMMLGTAGCAVTQATCGPYGCRQETVIVAPNGGVYYQQTPIAPQPYYGPAPGYHNHHHRAPNPYAYPNTRCIPNSWGGVACY